MCQEFSVVSESSGQQADVSAESPATTMGSSSSKSRNGEVETSDDIPSLQWDNADLSAYLLKHNGREHATLSRSFYFDSFTLLILIVSSSSDQHLTVICLMYLLTPS